ncbi:MAG: IS110 family transposase [Sodaliphilus sp.]|nr:IS110 family transposase [Sodaliphilus sp.]
MSEDKQLIAEKQIFIGCDVSKYTLDFAIYQRGIDYRKFKHHQVSNDEAGFKELLKWLKSNGVKKYKDTVVGIEHTGYYSNALAEWLFRKRITFCYLHPLDVKNYISSSRNKNDSEDACMIADYLYTMREKLTPSTPEPSKIKQLRALRNERALIIKSRTAFLNLLKNIDEPASIKRMQTIINELNTQVKAIEKSIMEAINSNEKIKQNYNLITTIPGIGLVNAINTIIATCNFTKFQTARQYAKFCCICPLSNESGISVRGGEHISKKGHNELKTDLTEAARSTIIHNSQMKAYYQRKRAQGKSHGCVMNAIKFKLVCRMFAVIIRQSPYVDFEKYRQ